jgi:lipoate-protein ligase A
MPPPRWLFLDSGALDGAENMAVDAGLADRARETGEAVLRVYAWSTPTLSFGRHESVRGRFAPEALRLAGVGAVRRPTGGRVLMHQREVTYSVTAPADETEPLSASFGRINSLLLGALSRLGVTASLAPLGRVLRPGGAACFSEPSGGELVVGTRKLVGSAQLRERGALLQHGSILMDDDQPRIAELASGPVSPPLPAATLRDSLGRGLSYEEVRDALRGALGDAIGDTDLLDEREAAARAAPHRARFASAEWTWRR